MLIDDGDTKRHTYTHTYIHSHTHTYRSMRLEKCVKIIDDRLCNINNEINHHALAVTNCKSGVPK